mmetsp:Transcript_39087/g.117504  ORF Transcript_39087/g.117504 Transcript_39087/m.117504 type:complete len:208 (-) Transcript_39087:34-657(-)
MRRRRVRRRLCRSVASGVGEASGRELHRHGVELRLGVSVPPPQRLRLPEEGGVHLPLSGDGGGRGERIGRGERRTGAVRRSVSDVVVRGGGVAVPRTRSVQLVVERAEEGGGDRVGRTGGRGGSRRRVAIPRVRGDAGSAHLLLPLRVLGIASPVFPRMCGGGEENRKGPCQRRGTIERSPRRRPRRGRSICCRASGSSRIWHGGAN